jgi:pyroglutamyl-peptidase
MCGTGLHKARNHTQDDGLAMVRVLVTGFEPFGGRQLNPSAELVARLDRRDVAAHTLPVSFARLRPALDELVAAHDPEFILGLGLAAGTGSLRLEQVAINVMASDIPDNDGATPSGQPIEPIGPAARFSNLDNGLLARRLLEDGIPIERSFHAGTHCCNLLLYHGMGLVERGRRQRLCGFLHLPCLPDQVTSDRLSGGIDRACPSLPLATMIAAVESILTVTV